MYQSIFTHHPGNLTSKLWVETTSLAGKHGIIESQITRPTLHCGYIPVFIRFIHGLMFYY